MKWFEVTLKVETNDEKKKETYLVDALTFAEAENRTSEYLFGNGSAVVEVGKENGRELIKMDWLTGHECLTVRKLKIGDVLECASNESSWYKVKVEYVMIDERTFKEKKSTTIYMIESTSIKEAEKRLDEYMKDTMSDWELVGIEKKEIEAIIRNG